MAEIRRKLVIVGDGACGKTCLLMYVIVDICFYYCYVLPYCFLLIDAIYHLMDGRDNLLSRYIYHIFPVNCSSSLIIIMHTNH